MKRITLYLDMDTIKILDEIAAELNRNELNTGMSTNVSNLYSRSKICRMIIKRYWKKRQGKNVKEASQNEKQD